MKNLKYILTGIIVLGAFGAKLGAYSSMATDIPSGAFQWIESGMIYGSFIGIIASIGILGVVGMKSSFKGTSEEKVTPANV